MIFNILIYHFIYFQEYKTGALSLLPGGEALSDFDQKQEHPLIARYSDINSLYVIIWEDYRSTGKEYCANLYWQSFTSLPCPDLGNMNGDDDFNVLDIVSLANCVIAQTCDEHPNGCAGDMNGDGGWNVLDIVTLANCVLAGTCGG